MTGIKQTVSNYIFGASNQSDQLKIPGFVREAINIYPDVTEGCEKRPGTRHISTLTGVGTTERTWFAIDHGRSERFIGRVGTSGNVRIWECNTGVERSAREIDNSRNYLRHSQPEDIQVVTINDYTCIVNRTVDTAMDSVVAYSAPEQGGKAFIDLSAIGYGKQYALDISLDNTSTVPQITTRATKLKIEWEPGGDRRNDSDNDSGKNVDSEESCRYNTREIRTINAVGSDRSAKGHAEYDDGDIINLPGKNLRFEVSMIGTPYIAGYHGSRNGEPYYWALYDINIDLLHGGEGWRKGDTFTLQIGDEEADGDTKHKVTVEEVEEIQTKANWLIRPEPTTHDGSQVLTADKILTDLKNEILRHNGDFTVEKIGTGLLLTDPNRSFKVTTTEGNLMSIIGSEASSAADLPSQCQEGYVVKISNSALDEDDYYLKFTGGNTWVETVAPVGQRNRILPETMPHQIVKNTDGTFDIKPMVWADRLAGDNTTNPKPTFLKGFNSGLGVGSSISNILFWRNRLVLLSKNNICLTQPLTDSIVSPGQSGQVYDVWGKSAIALSPGDAIDIVATSNQVCDLIHGIEVNAGLMLFSEKEQFLLTTDSDVVTPETVKVKRVSSWGYSRYCSPISLGNSIAFCDEAGRHSRLLEMSNITRETEPLVTELSKPITESIPTAVRSIAESRENGLVVLAHHSPYNTLNPDPWSADQGLSTVRTIGKIEDCQNPYNFVYCYKYFNSGNKRLQSAWFKWKFSGRVLWHTIIRDTYYFILDNDLTDVRLQAMDLVRKDTSFLNPNVLTEKCGPQRIHMDGMVDVTGTGTFDGTYTRFPIPASLLEWGSLAWLSIGSFRGMWNIIWYADDLEVVHAVPYVQNMNNSGFRVEGDITSSTSTVLGFAYDMILKLPEIYPTKKVGDSYIADTTSALTVHRCKFNLGLSGSIDIRVRSKDRRSGWYMPADNFSQYTHDDENAYGVLSSQQVDVPIYQTNTNFKLEFFSSDTMPCTLNSMTWEGDYNTLYRSA